MIRQTPVVRQASSRDGIACGCCSCCTCLHLSFLQTTPGILKIVQMVLGGLCQSMLINFGTSQASVVGMSYISLLTTNSACASTVTLLLICYIVSQNSFSLVRSSFFETLFNASAALSYLSSSAYLAAAVNLYLYPLYLVTLGFIAYPAMIAAYTMGFALGALHALDAYYCYRHFRGYR
ncbi:hypothetical protein GE061_018181 [Apolygus lucorum]|uniref:Uncharacterized protein n=1 Tax=Apolygus lucorum TaxID=248454 RepID=A0A6A4J502_APOLU|nr:hypothetical protein GE061_018181 [Apolygus lucorum]